MDKPSDTEAITVDNDAESAISVDNDAESYAHDPRIGQKIGPCKLKRVIGRGGMGTVYEAVQKNPRRTVALKMMRKGITSKSAMRRFEFEAQILARLKHPGIAAVYDAGTHDEGDGGVPYFVMEYIPNAASVTQYANDKKLGTRERLELFSKVCDAVQHGHMKGIVHRDLKPQNILVDSSGQPKVIDFGVARSTDSDLAVTTLQTDVGQLIGTLQYMSPEQVAADPNDIDTRSDVYSLGMVLYELLTGKPPYDVKTLAVHEAVQIIREEEPTKLSTIDRHLRGDVETMALKALDKERERRYQSAGALQEDIDRYLAGEAIAATPPSLWDQLSRLARRNRAAAIAVVTILIVLVGAVIGVSGFAAVAHKERRKAETALSHTAMAIETAQVAQVETRKAIKVAEGALEITKAAQEEAEAAREEAEKYSDMMERVMGIVLESINTSSDFESDFKKMLISVSESDPSDDPPKPEWRRSRLGELVADAEDLLEDGDARELRMLSQILYEAAGEFTPVIPWWKRLQWYRDCVLHIRDAEPNTWVNDRTALSALTIIARHSGRPIYGRSTGGRRDRPRQDSEAEYLWGLAKEDSEYLDPDALLSVGLKTVEDMVGFRTEHEEPLDPSDGSQHRWRLAAEPFVDLYTDSITSGVPFSEADIATATWSTVLNWLNLFVAESDQAWLRNSITRGGLLLGLQVAGFEDPEGLASDAHRVFPQVLFALHGSVVARGLGFSEDEHSLYFHQTMRDLAALCDQHDMMKVAFDDESPLLQYPPALRDALSTFVSLARDLGSDEVLAVVRASLEGSAALEAAERQAGFDLRYVSQQESELRDALIQSTRLLAHAGPLQDMTESMFNELFQPVYQEQFRDPAVQAQFLQSVRGTLSPEQLTRADGVLANLEGKSLEDIREVLKTITDAKELAESEALDEKKKYFRYLEIEIGFRVHNLEGEGDAGAGDH